ncbi:MAG: tRNA 2-thiouridine(34) synthase MnmA [Acidobacteriota bacterium]
MSTLIALSGGVDSSVAAWLLREAGHDLIGVSMQLWNARAHGGHESRCCSPADFRDARLLAGRLGFPYYVLDYEQHFESRVVRPFGQEYLDGRTPNPCVECNRYLKFGALLATAERLGAKRLGTGHYTRIDRDPATGAYRLRRARDLEKDQSYFLYSLGQYELGRVVFPLGALLKQQVRDVARRAGLAVADKPESQDLCFLGGRDRISFLSRGGEGALGRPGDIVSSSGQVLGAHRGLARYTVGQRRGLGQLSGGPWYVIRLDGPRNQLVVGCEAEQYADVMGVTGVHWVAGGPPAGAREALVRIRHAHHPAAAMLEPLPYRRARVRFAERQRAVTPGQAAVFYDQDIVLGGGRIESSSMSA